MTQTIYINQKLGDQAEYQYTKKLGRKAKLEIKYEKSIAYLNLEQEFILYQGMGPDRKEFKRKTMTGSEARELNRISEKQFMDGKTSRLWRWIGKSVIEKCTNPDLKGSHRVTPGVNMDVSPRSAHPNGRICLKR